MTCIFCKKIGQKRSILREIRAQTFYYPLYGVATAYSTNENPSTDKLSRVINYPFTGNSWKKTFFVRNPSMCWWWQLWWIKVVVMVTALEVMVKADHFRHLQSTNSKQVPSSASKLRKKLSDCANNMFASSTSIFAKVFTILKYRSWTNWWFFIIPVKHYRLLLCLYVLEMTQHFWWMEHLV